MSETRKIGDFHFVPTEVGTYAVRMEGGLNDTFERFLSFDPTSWDMDPVTVAGVRVVPWGADNNLDKKNWRLSFCAYRSGHLCRTDGGRTE